MSPPHRATLATHTFDRALQSRVEDAGINASAPREQLWVDGWLVRRCPGKAKRARCIQAVAAGRTGVDEKLARSLALYAEAGLRPYVRVTPFSEPAGLDERLAALGMERIDDTRVMIAPLPIASTGEGEDDGLRDGKGDGTGPPADGLRFDAVEADSFARWVGAERGSSASEQRAHAERLRASPVPHRAVLARDHTGQVVAGGQVAIELDLAGLYDVFTPQAARGHGHARVLCRYLLDVAASGGAAWAYLQVEASNVAARRVYTRLGFADAYAYHYRTPPTS